MFKASAATKRPSKKAADDDDGSGVGPSTKAEVEGAQPQPQVAPTLPFANPFAQMPFMGYPPVLGYPMLNTPFANPYMPWPPFPNPAMPATNRDKTPPRRISDDIPSSPIAPSCTVVEFCKLYSLGDDVETGLEQLGFEMGDDLKVITETQYTQAGFKPLAWQRVLRAYKKYKRDHV